MADESWLQQAYQALQGLVAAPPEDEPRIPGQWPGWEVARQRMTQMAPGWDRLTREGPRAALMGQETTTPEGFPSRMADITPPADKAAMLAAWEQLKNLSREATPAPVVTRRARAPRTPRGTPPAPSLEELAPMPPSAAPRVAKRVAESQQLTRMPSAGGGEANVLEAMRSLEPQAYKGALVYIPELREALKAQYPTKEAFDRAIMRLAAAGKVQLQSHDLPSQLKTAERAAMIDNKRGSYFMGIGLRVDD